MTAIDHVTKARAQMLVEEPFWGTLAMHLKLVPVNDPSLWTMATDGKHLYYHPDIVNRIGVTDPRLVMKRLKLIWKHEVLHLSLGHHARMGGRDRYRWNVACDHVDNLILQSGGEEIPPEMYCDARFKGFTAEQVYRILEDEERQQQQQDQDDEDEEQEPPENDGEFEEEQSSAGQDEDDPQDGDDEADDGEADGEGQGGDADGEGQPGGDAPGGATDEGGDRPGSGAGDAGQGGTAPAQAGSGSEADGGGVPQTQPAFSGYRGGGCGEILPAAPPADKAANDDAKGEWEVFTQQAVNVARRQGEGRLPGFAQEIVDQISLTTTDWRDALRKFVDPVSQTKDFSWSSPSRRMMGLDYYVPGTISDGIHHLVLIVDSSYSIDSALLATFGSEVQTVLDEGGIDRCTLVFCDTDVTRTASYVKGEQIDFTVPGRGGTRFSPAFQWVTENCTDVACAIYFTDLDCTDFGQQPDYPVLWAAYGSPLVLRPLMERVPFGECIDVAA